MRTQNGYRLQAQARLPQHHHQAGMQPRWHLCTIKSMRHRTLITATALTTLLGLASTAHAQFADMRQTPTLYMQAGNAKRDANAYTLGSTVPFKNWHTYWWGYAVTAHWDMSLSTWNSDKADDAGRQRVTVLGFTPTLRFHSKNQYPWFVEAGVGGYVSNHLYSSRDNAFSTKFNFGTHVGVGYFTGYKRENEWAIRVEHISNAGIKSPNPKENFVQLRYARHF